MVNDKNLDLRFISKAYSVLADREIYYRQLKRLEKKDKETEKKIISLYNFIVKHNKQSPVMIKDSILKRFEKDFPEYFKEE